MSVFLVEKGTPGFSAGPPLDKLGAQAPRFPISDSKTASFRKTGCSGRRGRVFRSPEK